MASSKRSVCSAGAAAAELQQLFRMVHGNQAAMDGFGEYRSDLLLRVFSQSTSEPVSN
jgi:hypothetical protein